MFGLFFLCNYMVSLWLLWSSYIIALHTLDKETRYASYDPIASVCFYVVSRQLIYNFHSNYQLSYTSWGCRPSLLSVSVSGLSRLDLVMYMNLVLVRVTLLNRISFYASVEPVHSCLNDSQLKLFGHARFAV